MSRIGRMPIQLPAGVEVKVSADNVVTVKGPKGELSREVAPVITVKVENNLAVIDGEKCTGCGKCAEKCPKKIIHPQKLAE